MCTDTPFLGQPWLPVSKEGDCCPSVSPSFLVIKLILNYSVVARVLCVSVCVGGGECFVLPTEGFFT